MNRHQTTRDMNTTNNIYRRIHFAVMAIESGARKLGISGKEMDDTKSGKVYLSQFIAIYEKLR